MMTNKWFPAICEILGTDQESIETMAHDAFDLIKSILTWPYHPELGDLIKDRNEYLKKRFELEGRPELYKFALQWQDEITNCEETGIVRAQFLKSYKAKSQGDIRRQIETSSDHTKKLLQKFDEIGKLENE